MGLESTILRRLRARRTHHRRIPKMLLRENIASLLANPHLPLGANSDLVVRQLVLGPGRNVPSVHDPLGTAHDCSGISVRHCHVYEET